jgi:hypothetical protein
MVNLLNKNQFILLLAKRNILANKKTTAVIIITLSLIFAIFMMMLGIRGIYKDIFTKEFEYEYENVDIVITYDEYSLARFINKRYITQNYEEVDYALAFFNLQVLLGHSDDLFYGQLHSALSHELEILLDIDVDIENDEMLITESLAFSQGLKIGDRINFSVFGKEFTYTIATITPDKGVFRGNAFFIDKADLLQTIYGMDYLNNFGNVIYVKTDNIENVYEQLTLDETYSDYGIRLVVDEERIDALISEYISIISLAGVIVLVALAIILNSLFLIVVRDIYQEIGVFDTLGDNKKTGYIVCYFQWLIYIGISFLIGTIIAHIVANIGGQIYGIKEFLLINPLIILLTLLIIISLIILNNYLLIKKFYKKNSINKIKDKRFVLAKANYFIQALSLLVLLMTLIVKPFDTKFNALIIVATSIYLSLVFSIILLRIISRILSKNKTVFALFNTKHMDLNKNIHQALNVIFIALMVVTIMLTVRFFISDQIEEVRANNKFNLVMTNIQDYNENLIDEIKTYDVTNADPVLIYSDVLVSLASNDNFLIRMFVSIEQSAFNDYYGDDISFVDEDIKNSELPYVLLSSSYKEVYELKVGDLISIDLNPEIRDFTFILGGFLDSEFDQFAYTNLSEKLTEYSLQYNAIMINSDNPEAAMSELIKGFGSRMYYLIDGQAELEKQISRSYSVLDLFTVLTFFIVSSFMFVVFNNTLLKFYSLKNDYSKIKVLGLADKFNFSNLIKEFFVLFGCLIIVGTIEIIILSRYLREVLLFFDYYKHMTADVHITIFSYVLIFISLLLSYIYYYFKVKSISLSEEIRII